MEKEKETEKETPTFIHCEKVFMENENPTFLKVSDNTVINVKKIQWIKKYKECMYVCTKSSGCTSFGAHKICKKNNMDIYFKLDNYFEE